MTDVPPDILSTAVAVVDRGYNVGLIDAVCEALMAEREAQRERDAKIAEAWGAQVFTVAWAGGPPNVGEAAKMIAERIRSPDTPTPQDET